MLHPITPYGGQLVSLISEPNQQSHWQKIQLNCPSWSLTPRQLCDLELLLCGGFSPLTGFLNQADYQQVVEHSRLADGTLWPIPIVLDWPASFVKQLADQDWVSLCDREGVAIALLQVQEIWQPNKLAEVLAVYGTEDPSHVGVNAILHETHDYYVSGQLIGLQMPEHYDFKPLRHTPQELRHLFEKRDWRRIAAFQTRNPMHRAHYELTIRATHLAEANLLIQPVVGVTKPGDVHHFGRVRCYERLMNRYPEQTTMLSLLPLAMRMAGPKEALWHAIIRRNYGCSHFIVGRDHAGPGKSQQGKAFYGDYEAQHLLAQHQPELGIELLTFPEMVYVPERAEYVPTDRVAEHETVANISGTEFRRRLQKGLDIPEWFSYPEVMVELRQLFPPLHRQGFTVFFTGLSGAGKSTIANALMVKLMELGGRPVTLLDGDVVRQHLSSELGFSPEHRDLNILRIAYVASEITKNGGIAICAPIAPYRRTRQQVRDLIEPLGGFLEIHVATSLDVCEQRDRKGLYAKARAGLIENFTGISDPYQPPENPDLIIDTQDSTPNNAAQQVILRLERLGYIQ